MTKSVIVRTQVKELAKVGEKRLFVSEDFYTELEGKVKRMIEESCKRAKLNGRNTVMGKDV
ncbi:hypothetical protein J4212_03370 [Candidatus Woesearchaeota archaeon]|nr:hypothetical protein [Candidatus Woesearchaeota archaeon]